MQVVAITSELLPICYVRLLSILWHQLKQNPSRQCNHHLRYHRAPPNGDEKKEKVGYKHATQRSSKREKTKDRLGLVARRICVTLQNKLLIVTTACIIQSLCVCLCVVRVCFVHLFASMCMCVCAHVTTHSRLPKSLELSDNLKK